MNHYHLNHLYSYYFSHNNLHFLLTLSYFRKNMLDTFDVVDTESNQSQQYYKHISFIERGDKSQEVVDDDTDHNTNNIKSLISTPAIKSSS